MRRGFPMGIGLLICFFWRWVPDSFAAENPQTNNVEHWEEAYHAAKTAFQGTGSDAAAVVAFGRACFDLAESGVSHSRKAALAHEGIAACTQGLIVAPASGELHYYLAQNLAELAQTKRLGALRILRQMEDHWQTARTLNEDLDYAGPDRSLGLLYREAPLWPASVGSRSKARQHLERAVKIAPDYPENRIALAEALHAWHEREHAREVLKAIEAGWDEARQKFSGERWEADWRDWTRRKEALVKELGEHRAKGK
jgi:tetratricopeptide (TPR) repeat protein